MGDVKKWSRVPQAAICQLSVRVIGLKDISVMAYPCPSYARTPRFGAARIDRVRERALVLATLEVSASGRLCKCDGIFLRLAPRDHAKPPVTRSLHFCAVQRFRERFGR